MKQPTMPNAGTAVVLSLLCTGLGHLVRGRIRRGLTLFLLSLVLVPAAGLLAVLAPSSVSLIVLIAAVFGYLALALFAVVDSVRAGDPSGPSILRPLPVALFIVVGLTSPWAQSWLLRHNVVACVEIAASSMAPTLLDGDRIVADRLGLRLRSLERGQVVVFRDPRDRRQLLVKRIIALEGDEVRLAEGEVHLNGRPLERQRLPRSAVAGLPEGPSREAVEEVLGGRVYRVLPEAETPEVDLELSVPAGSVLVLGDHRGNSVDSRHFGCVPLGDVLGEVIAVAQPAVDWRRFGLLGSAR